MFTGIVTDLGRVLAVEKRGDTRFRIATSYDLDSIDMGASIACSGCCLTVVEKGETDGQGWFEVDVSAETLKCTKLGHWSEGTPINLERSLKLGDEMGGHIVSGHVDGLGTIVEITDDGDSKRFEFEVDTYLGHFIAEKGSVALDGTSLTVNVVREIERPEAGEMTRFWINIIPHTQEVTTWGSAKAGDKVNVEIDMLARYVARLAEFE